MSRTSFAFTPPNRRSKRLLANGYYRVPAAESGNSSDQPLTEDEDTASVDTNVSRSSHLPDDRSITYHETSGSPVFHKNRRYHRAGGSPAVAKLHRVEQPGGSRRKLPMRYVTGSHSERITRTEVVTQVATTSTSAAAFGHVVSDGGRRAAARSHVVTGQEAGEGFRPAPRPQEQSFPTATAAPQPDRGQERGDLAERDSFVSRKRTQRVSGRESSSNNQFRFCRPIARHWF